MKDWKRTLIRSDATLREAFAVIEASGLQVALVVDDVGRLEGILTDGDLRRALLAGVSLADSVANVTNRQPECGSSDQTRAEHQAAMRGKGLHHLPIVDELGRPTGLEVASHLLDGHERPNAAVVMVGGLGSRLRPLLKGRPKPLVTVGAKPVLQRIIEGLKAAGVQRVFLAVHYRADMIEEFCGNGARWGVSIEYLRERSPLGTAGALSLLERRLEEPALVLNGDLVTEVDFGRVLDFHTEHGADLTMGLTEFDFEIPYGVVSTRGVAVTGIEEKPTRCFYVSAGIYAVDPAVIHSLERGSQLDMPDLARRLITEGRSVVGFPIAEYWIDVGHADDLYRARKDLGEPYKGG